MNRELAAIYSRDKQFSADQYIYVVDSAQSYHFNKLKTVLEFFGDEKIASKIQHLSYGRIIGRLKIFCDFKNQYK